MDHVQMCTGVELQDNLPGSSVMIFNSQKNITNFVISLTFDLFHHVY
jgi:hypothetical protein